MVGRAFTTILPCRTDIQPRRGSLKPVMLGHSAFGAIQNGVPALWAQNMIPSSPNPPSRLVSSFKSRRCSENSTSL